MYGIPFRSDARFEMYNSSGYTYNASSKILYVKMRHKSEYETIRLSIGSAPQSSSSIRPAQSISASNENAVAPSVPSVDIEQKKVESAEPSQVQQLENPMQSDDSAN